MIGILGGLSSQSTATYYKYLNELVLEKSGNAYSPEIMILSLDSERVVNWLASKSYPELKEYLLSRLPCLINSGVKCVAIPCNTVHMFAEELKANCPVPFLHIADSLVKKLAFKNLKNTGILGTEHTKVHQIYDDRMKEYGIKTSYLNELNQNELDSIIFNDLCAGNVSRSARVIEFAKELVVQGADSICLACTELSGLVKQSDVSVPVFDSTISHIEDIANFSVELKE